MLSEQFQNRPGFQIEHGKSRPFPSQLGNSITTIRDILTFISVKDVFPKIVSIIFTSKVMRWGRTTSILN